MAARATGKPKQTAGPSASAKTGHTASAAQAPTAKKSATRRSSTDGAGKAKSSLANVGSDTGTELLIEQNQALRAELEHANARIRQLEELNRNVVNRIDWVIDSLQSALAAKR